MLLIHKTQNGVIMAPKKTRTSKFKWLRETWDSIKNIIAGITVISAIAIPSYLVNEKLNTFATSNNVATKSDMEAITKSITELSVKIEKMEEKNKEQTDKLSASIENIYNILIASKKR